MAMFDPDLAALLRCPRTGKTVTATEKSLVGGDGFAFPAVGQIPWFFADPSAQLWQWRANARLQLQSMARQIEALKLADRDPSLSDLAHKRVARRLQAEIEHSKALLNLLQPLAVDDQGEVELSRTFGAKVPITQALSSYYDNVHRDWGWDDEIDVADNENAITARLASAVVGEGYSGGTMTVLGAGACRLSFDLHQQWSCATTLNVDINPLLFLSAARIAAGKAVKLYEFPIAPKDLDSVAVPRKLKAPHGLKNGFSFLFADAMDPPFCDNAFDTVLTPWFIDIVPQDMFALFAKLNRIVKPGGLWVNLGSTAFVSSDFGRRYTPEEVLAAVEVSGFEVVRSSHESIPYMCSPASCHGRRERVLTFAAKKIAPVAPQEPFQYLPDWLIDSDKPIPKTQDVIGKAVAHRIYFDVLSLIDGNRSVSQVAGLVAQKYGMQPEEALASFKRFLTTIYEEGRQGPIA